MEIGLGDILTTGLSAVSFTLLGVAANRLLDRRQRRRMLAVRYVLSASLASIVKRTDVPIEAIRISAFQQRAGKLRAVEQVSLRADALGSDVTRFAELVHDGPGGLAYQPSSDEGLEEPWSPSTLIGVPVDTAHTIVIVLELRLQRLSSEDVLAAQDVLANAAFALSQFKSGRPL